MKNIPFIRCGVILFVPLLSFAGPIPEALGALTDLMRLNVRNNKLTGNHLLLGIPILSRLFLASLDGTSASLHVDV